jgi:predicted permease
VGTFRWGRSDDDLEEELRVHAAMAADDASRASESAAAARRSAALRHGGIAQAMDAQRDRRGVPWLRSLGRDVRYAGRILARTPGSSLFAVLSLAIALGTVTSVASVVNALYLRPLALHAPQQLVLIATVSPENANSTDEVPLAVFEEIRGRSQDFADVFAWRDGQARNLDAGSGTFFGNVNEVSGEYFAALGVGPLLGRVLAKEDVASIGVGRSAPMAVLDYRCWVHHYGRDPAVLGKTLVVDGTPLTIVGVTAESFVGLNVTGPPDAIVPIGFDTGRLDVRDGPLIFSVGARLKHGTQLGSAARQVAALWPSVLEATLPPGVPPAERGRYLGMRSTVQSLQSGTAGAGMTVRSMLAAPLKKLSALSALVPVVACLNLANLLLARSASRRQELVLRAALGATRGALVQTTVLEGVVLSLSGGALGVLAAFWMGPLLTQMMTAYPQAPKPYIIDARPDLTVLGWALVLAIAVGAISALLPAARLIAGEEMSGTPGVATPIGGPRRSLLQRTLIGAQITLALVLVVTALMFARSLNHLQRVDPGFRVENMLQMHLFPLVKDQEYPDRVRYYRQVAERLSTVPGVAAVTFCHPGPMLGGPSTPVSIRGTRETDAAALAFAGPGFFRSMGMTLLAGREFGWTDDERSPPVAIISDSLEQRLFPGSTALGRSIEIPGMANGRALEIVGVVNSASYADLHHRRPQAVYVALMQMEGFNHFLVELHVTGNSMAVATAANKALVSLGREYSFLTNSLESLRDFATRDERLLSLLSTCLAGLTLLLAAGGLYAVLAYTVAVRTAEIGLRMAVGAERSDIVWMVLGEAARIVTFGLVVGVLLTLSVGRLVADRLFEVTTIEPVMFGLAMAIISGVVLVAALIPAQRASRVDPQDALRCG